MLLLTEGRIFEAKALRHELTGMQLSAGTAEELIVPCIRARTAKKELALTSPCAMVTEQPAEKDSICQKLHLLSWSIEEQ
jgi:hypothetical protein